MKSAITISTAIALSFFSLTAFAQQTKVGVLTCYTSARVGLIVGSTQKLACTFTPELGPVPEHYLGTINRIGPDIGVTAGGVLTWAVIAPTSSWLMRGALAGEYVGASGDASVVLGVGANVLVGGSNRSVALQPLSVEGQIGLNVALGVSGLTLVESY